MQAVAIPIVVSVLMVLSIVRDAASSTRAHARMDVFRRERNGLPQLGGRTAQWWQRELDTSFRARFRYQRLLAAENDDRATKREPLDPSARARLTTLIRQALAFSVLVGTLAGWVTHSYVRGLIVAGLMAFGIAVPAYYVRRLGRPSDPTR